jgi:LysM repeat protein
MKTRSFVLAVGLGLMLFLSLLWGMSAGAGAVEAAQVTATPTPTPASAFITLTVKSGDSLAVYARRYGVTGAAMMRVNPQIKDGNLIFPGQVITIPVVRTFTPSLTTPFFYVVQAGDTINTIAAKYEMNVNALARANGTSFFTTGQTILIPAGPHEHVVVKGEDLKTIAARYGVTVSFLLTGNNLPNPDLIFVGQVIFVPVIYNAQPLPFTGVAVTTPTPSPTGPTPTPSKTPTPGATPTATKVGTTSEGFIQTVVRSGESFVTYTYRYGVSGGRLRAANPQLRDPSLIFPGQVITIPVAASFTPSRTTPFFYVVQSGDSTTSIAAKYEMTSETLVRANPGASFAAGTTILVPAGPHVYTVKEGDELKTIAPKYGVTVEFLLTGNNLPNPDRIFVGQLIFIPIRYDAEPIPFTP